MLNKGSLKRIGLIGTEFENYLTKNTGGEGSSKGGRDFNGGIGK